MSFEGILPNNPAPRQEGAVEGKAEIPERLFRGFVIDPEVLSTETFQQTLQPTEGIKQGANEPGVYMSDNLEMVKSTSYSAGSFTMLQTSRYDMGRGMTNGVELPGCGIVLEIDTVDLAVREPRIDPVYRGHYNNGFQGKEWIADVIPPSNYHVKMLTLGTHVNDPNKLVIELQSQDPQELADAVARIKEAYEVQKREAEAFKAFIEGLPESSRVGGFMLKRKWEQYKQTL
ncbi:MAG: hypothetical protein QG633_60 [Patescibacteria group bacterium]|jgi:hypothetical protein|nr:hypothetical protein [Patescibacteria group bacterium]MDQ5927622.1 hypothetical protein [Patescibacteria group bacterium]